MSTKPTTKTRAAKKPTPGAAKDAQDKTRTLQIADNGSKTWERLLADVMTQGVAGNAFTAVNFSKGAFGDLSMTDCWDAMTATAKEVHGGDLRSAETMLTAQAAALNAIFGEMARRSALNMGEYLDASERYMRLALKAQGQCRATLETLAAIKNPPVVFARQANINNGGQQQVNNGTAPPVSPHSPHPPATASGIAPTELLEASHGEWMDTRATGQGVGADPCPAPVGKVHRPAG